MKVMISDLGFKPYFDMEELNTELMPEGDMETSLMDIVNYVPNVIVNGATQVITKVNLEFDKVIDWLEDGVEVKVITGMVSPDSIADKDKFNFNKELKIPTIPGVQTDLVGIALMVGENIPTMYKELGNLLMLVDKEVARYLTIENYTIGASVPSSVVKAKKNLVSITDSLKDKVTKEEVSTISIIDAFGNFNGSITFYQELKKVIGKVKPKDVYKLKDGLTTLNKRLDNLYEVIADTDGVSKTSMKVLTEMLTVLANYSTAFSVNYGLYLDLCEIEQRYVELLKDADNK